MIEVVSYPLNLMDWDKDSIEQPFYFELYGESQPMMALDFTQVLPDSRNEHSLQTNSELPIYEYFWILGHGGISRLDSLLAHLKNPAAYVYLYFPISRGWRVKELIATVKYLTSVPEQKKWLQKIVLL
jgi:hypothetical protein